MQRHTYCEEHRCTTERCESASSFSDSKCFQHTSEQKCLAKGDYKVCDSQALPGRNFCLSHACKETSCNNEVEFGQYCKQLHRCSLEFCREKSCSNDVESKSEEKYNYCTRHKCTVEKCTKGSLEYSSYCHIHSCSNYYCRNAKLDGSKYCELHNRTCTHYGCNEQRDESKSRTYLFCQEHKCDEDDCNNDMKCCDHM
jgi:hypothetical protein